MDPDISEVSKFGDCWNFDEWQLNLLLTEAKHIAGFLLHSPLPNYNTFNIWSRFQVHTELTLEIYAPHKVVLT